MNKENPYSEITVALMAAGLGTRLRPLTNTMPKVMVPIAEGKPLLEHTVCLMRDQGFRRFVVNLHYMPEKITSHFGDGDRFGVRIVYTDETEKLLETAGGLKKMEPHLSDTFIVAYADMAHFFDFRPLVDFHRKHGALATIALGRSGVPQDGDIAEVELATSRIVQWHRRPHTIHAYDGRYFWNAGFYVMSKELLGHIPEDRPMKLDAEILPGLIKEGKVFGYITDNKEIFDLGMPEKYEFVKQWYAKRSTGNNG